MSSTVQTLYDTDFAEWAMHMAELVRARRFDELDIENLVEELEGLASNERSAVCSQLYRMLFHLIKQAMQPERSGKSWRLSIVNARERIQRRLDASPSLRRVLERQLEKLYRDAVKDAIYEMQLPPERQTEIPERCPYTLDDLLERYPEPWR